jgi:hypothetical protein
MLANFLSVWDSLTVTSPFILVCLLLALSCNLTRSTKRDRPGKQRRAKSAFSAAAFSIGIGLQFYDQITRPGVQQCSIRFSKCMKKMQTMTRQAIPTTPRLNSTASSNAFAEAKRSIG